MQNFAHAYSKRGESRPVPPSHRPPELHFLQMDMLEFLNVQKPTMSAQI